MNAFAKVNLSLDILGKYPDGYHEIASVFHSIDFFDSLSLRPIDNKNLILDSNIKIENNILHKIWHYISSNYDVKSGVYVNLEKNIPLMAGLGGGSSDAAAFLYAINLIFSLGLKRKDLLDLSLNFGSDIAYFFYGGMCLVEGRGEKVSKLEEYLEEKIILILPNKGISTSFAYNLYDKDPKITNYTKQFCDERRRGFIKTGNVFEDLILPIDSDLKKIKEVLNGLSDWNLMSGSGSVFFAKSENETLIGKELEGLAQVRSSVLKPLNMDLIEL
ncbi:MAG: 4-(cytidine 5'-diphospho)-2-C-methyl-D-erythritol kinase [Thermodesulfobium sp.]